MFFFTLTMIPTIHQQPVQRFSHSQAKTDFLILSEPLVYEPGRYSEAVVDRIGRRGNRFCKGFLCCFYLWYTKSYEKSPS